MIKQIFNILNKEDKIILKNIILNLKKQTYNIEVKQFDNNNFEIYTNNILRDPKMFDFYSNNIKPILKNDRLLISNNYLEWSRSNNRNMNIYPSNIECYNYINCVLVDNNINYKYCQKGIVYKKILNNSDLLIFDQYTPIEFYNYKISNLLFFSFHNISFNDNIMENEG
jgi:hypothetical protein